MFKVVPFDVSHIFGMLEEPHNRDISWWKDEHYRYPKYLAKSARAFTGMFGNAPMVCAFIVDIWEGRGYLVVVLSSKIKKHAVSVFRGMQKFLRSQPYRRLEMDSPVDFELGHRRARMLGFELVTECARKYLPDGSDAAIYAWVRE